jgi:hypothetical protein
MLTDLLAGQVQVAFDNLQPSIPHIKAGKLRALAVTTATPRPRHDRFGSECVANYFCSPREQHRLNLPFDYCSLADRR